MVARNAIRRRRASSFSSASWAILSQSVCWRCDSARCVSVRLASSANSPHSAALVRNSEPGIGGFCSTNHGESEQNRSSLPHPVSRWSNPRLRRLLCLSLDQPNALGGKPNRSQSVSHQRRRRPQQPSFGRSDRWWGIGKGNADIDQTIADVR